MPTVDSNNDGGNRSLEDRFDVGGPVAAAGGDGHGVSSDTVTLDALVDTRKGSRRPPEQTDLEYVAQILNEDLPRELEANPTMETAEFYVTEVARVLDLADPKTRVMVDGFMNLAGMYIGVKLGSDKKDAIIAHYKELCEKDALTGLYNRAFIEQHYARHHQAHARREESPITVFAIDGDYFKQINDTYGHDAGDEALRIYANVFQQTTREVDTVVRKGGDEFEIVAHTDAEGAEIMIKKIQETLAANPLYVEGGKAHPLSVTIGAAEGRYDTPYDILAKAADTSLYAAKKTQRGSYHILKA